MALGNALIVVGMMCYAAYFIYSKSVVGRYGPVTVSFYVMLFAGWESCRWVWAPEGISVSVAPLVLPGEQLTFRVLTAGLTIFAGLGLVISSEFRQQCEIPHWNRWGSNALTAHCAPCWALSV